MLNNKGADQTAQTDLHLCCSHMAINRFSHDVAHKAPIHVMPCKIQGAGVGRNQSFPAKPSWAIHQMSHVTRKPIFGVCDQGSHKPVC